MDGISNVETTLKPVDYRRREDAFGMTRSLAGLQVDETRNPLRTNRIFGKRKRKWASRNMIAARIEDIAQMPQSRRADAYVPGTVSVMSKESARQRQLMDFNYD